MGSPAHQEGTASVLDELVSPLLLTTPAMSIPMFPFPLHWTKAAHCGRADSFTLPRPGLPHPDFPPLGFAELPVTCTSTPPLTVPQPPSPSAQRRCGHLANRTPPPKAWGSSLFGGRRGRGAGAPLVTHLLSVAGGSLEVAEERPGLSDHRQQGKRLLEDPREDARARDGDSDTKRDRVRGRKKERSFSGEQSKQTSGKNAVLT